MSFENSLHHNVHLRQLSAISETQNYHTHFSTPQNEQKSNLHSSETCSVPSPLFETIPDSCSMSLQPSNRASQRKVVRFSASPPRTQQIVYDDDHDEHNNLDFMVNTTHDSDIDSQHSGASTTTLLSSSSDEHQEEFEDANRVHQIRAHKAMLRPKLTHYREHQQHQSKNTRQQYHQQPSQTFLSFPTLDASLSLSSFGVKKSKNLSLLPGQNTIQGYPVKSSSTQPSTSTLQRTHDHTSTRPQPHSSIPSSSSSSSSTHHHQKHHSKQTHTHIPQDHTQSSQTRPVPNRMTIHNMHDQRRPRHSSGLFSPQLSPVGFSSFSSSAASKSTSTSTHSSSPLPLSSVCHHRTAAVPKISDKACTSTIPNPTVVHQTTTQPLTQHSLLHRPDFKPEQTEHLKPIHFDESSDLTLSHSSSQLEQSNLSSHSTTSTTITASESTENNISLSFQIFPKTHQQQSQQSQ